MKRIAIIGAGLSGLVLARQLSGFADVVIYEKARGVGGRMSTRYAEEFSFDHGAQCFTARSESFRHFLEPFITEKIIAEWRGSVVNLYNNRPSDARVWQEPHYVASPNMNSLCKALAQGLDVRLGHEVMPITRMQDKWLISFKNSSESDYFDWVISTAPPSQTNNIFAQHAQIEGVALKPCVALMVGIKKQWHHEWIAGKVHDNPLKWISINSTKPGRNNNVTCIVAHSQSSWAKRHIDWPAEKMQQSLLSELKRLTGIEGESADYVSTHLWRYAIVERTQKAVFFCDPTLKLAATSDWGRTSRIEEVYLNALDLSRKLQEIL